MDSIILLVAMIAVFYFLIIRPENKRKKQAENMRNSLKKGERITTIGGLVGRIVQVNDATAFPHSRNEYWRTVPLVPPRLSVSCLRSPQ